MHKQNSLWLEAAVVALALTLTMHAAVSAKPDGNVVTVRMEGKKFVPDQITVHAGDTVEWVNEPDGRKHQVTTDPEQAVDANNVSMPKNAKPFDSGTIKAGESYRFRFTVPGTYRYTCPPHEMSGMIGTVVVQP